MSALLRRLRAFAVVPPAVAVLAGCSAGGPAATAVPVPTTTHPVVTGPQARTVLDAVGAAVDTVASGSVPPGDSPRVVGPVRQQVAVQLRLPARLRTSLPAGQQAWQRVLVPTGTGWPRWFLAVGTAPDHPTPLLSVLSSATARAPYGLWAQLTMLPGQALPAVAPAAEGAPVLDGRATGLALAPADVATRYADLLSRGSASPATGLFAEDLFRTQVRRQVSRDRSALAGLATVRAEHEAVPDSVLALRTSDGGALVVAELTATYLLTASPRSKELTVDDTLAALAGRSDFTERVRRTSQEVVAFAVPPQGTGGQIRVVAASKADVAVTGA